MIISTQTMEVTAIDIPSMIDMSEEEYRELLNDFSLFYVDHHEILRSTPAGYPLATSTEQLSILIEALESLRSRMISRS